MRSLSIINQFLYFFNIASLLLLLLSYLSPYVNPIVFWPIAFIGLIFPVLYIINILFLTYWIIILKKPIWINIVILIIGAGNINKYIGTSTNNSSSEDNLKILTYNVRLFNKYNWLEESNIQKKTVNFLESENPDILCIQEFSVLNNTQDLNYDYRHIGLQNKKSQWHMAIYSHYPQIEKKTVPIKGKTMNNTCIYSDIIIKKDTLRVYNIHLASNWFNNSEYAFIQNPQKEKFTKKIIAIIKRMRKSYKERAKEVNAIKKHMRASPYPIIVGGDFNDTPLSFAYHSIKENLIDAFSFSGKGLGTSFVEIPGLRIDYILHDPKFKSTNYQISNQILSDHYAVSCEIITP